ncbi:hypothetical protein V3C99_008488 [Haemonchus contortus]
MKRLVISTSNIIRSFCRQFERLLGRIGPVGHIPTFSALAEEVHCGVSTVQSIVYEVASAIRSVLYREAFPPLTRQQMQDVAAKTEARYDYPRAVGFMDGKHKHQEACPLWRVLLQLQGHPLHHITRPSGLRPPHYGF